MERGDQSASKAEDEVYMSSPHEREDPDKLVPMPKRVFHYLSARSMVKAMIPTISAMISMHAKLYENMYHQQVSADCPWSPYLV